MHHLLWHVLHELHTHKINSNRTKLSVLKSILHVFTQLEITRSLLRTLQIIQIVLFAIEHFTLISSENMRRQKCAHTHTRTQCNELLIECVYVCICTFYGNARVHKMNVHRANEWIYQATCLICWCCDHKQSIRYDSALLHLLMRIGMCLCVYNMHGTCMQNNTQ